MDTDVRLSLVMNTRDRGSVLGQCLAALGRLRCREPWELVLVDNGSSDETPRLLAAFRDAAPAPCRVLEERRRGSSCAKNTGWRAARGAIVCFTDDDCYPAPDYLDRMLDAFAEPAVGFVAGRLLLYDPSDLPTGIKPETSPREYPPGFAFPPGELHGANFAFRREVLERIDGFDELTGAGTPWPFEDVDAVMRASLFGFAGRYDPRPVVYHHHRRRDRQALQAVEHGYARGRGAYFVKYLALARRGPRLDLLKRWVGCIRYHGVGWLPVELRAGLGYLLTRVSQPQRGRA
jgi:glycosyltransferase involved in cell wall biosynthesis